MLFKSLPGRGGGGKNVSNAVHENFIAHQNFRLLVLISCFIPIT